MEIIRTYETDVEWCEYVIVQNIVIMSAHSDNKTYSRQLWREMKQIMAIKGEIVTELSYNYLIEFFSKHYEVIELGKNIFKIKDSKWVA